MNNALKVLLTSIFSGSLLLLVRKGFASDLKVINITEQLVRSSDRQYLTRPIGEITDVTIHHSRSEGQDAFDYAKYHVNVKGWPGVAYHFDIQPDGTIFQTNYLTTVSWHNGTDNAGAVGVCLSGNMDNRVPTDKQLKSAIQLIKWLKRKLPNRIVVKGHNEYKSTTCPGKYMPMKYIRSRTNS